MRPFKDQPIRNKLIIMLTAVSTIALLLASTFFFFHEKIGLERNARSHGQTMARVISHNAAAYLLFDDVGAASQDLGSLGKDPNIVRAEIKNAEGKTFALYERENKARETLQIDEEVMLDNRRIGTVALLMDMDQVYHALEHTAWSVATTLVFSILVALLLATWMQRWISHTITSLSGHMNRVRESNDYSLRATKKSDDELGMLTDGFNAMLEQIELRDAELSENQRQLERRVEERTHDLKAANLKLYEQMEERRLLASALEQAGDAIVIANRDGTIIYSNESFANINGYSSEETIGQPLQLLKSDRHNSAFYRKLWNDLEKDGAWSGKVWNRRKNGEVYPAQLHLKPVTNTDGKITHYVGAYADIHEYATLEEQLIQAQKMEAIGTLVGGIAHDFNNMLGSISIYSHLAMEEVKDRPKTFDRLKVVADISQDAATMIRQLLTFARKDSVYMEPLSLTPLIKESIKLSQASIPENIRVIADITHDPMVVEANATQIQQVLINLINNARDAVENAKEPEISISFAPYIATPEFTASHGATLGAHYGWLTVSDNGHGIAQNNMKNLFEPFFTTKEPGKGTGLGLAMVYGAIKSHGGIIEVESQLGKGASFHVYLPVRDSLVSHHHEASFRPIHGHGETVLIADDDIRIRRPLAEFLSGLGYTVLVAEDGLQAIEIFKQHKNGIALAIIDAVMPNMSGPQAVARIRAEEANLPVIFGTGYDKELLDEILVEDGYTHVMDKPFDLTVLSMDIRKMVNDQS